MIRIHETGGLHNYAVPVGIRIVAKSDVKAVLQRHQAGHCIWTRTIHPDLPVVIHCHEAESRIYFAIDNINLESVLRGDWIPVVERSAAQRIAADRERGSAQTVHVDHHTEVAYIWRDIVMLLDRRIFDR